MWLLDTMALMDPLPPYSIRLKNIEKEKGEYEDHNEKRIKCSSAFESRCFNSTNGVCAYHFHFACPIFQAGDIVSDFHARLPHTQLMPEH